MYHHVLTVLLVVINSSSRNIYLIGKNLYSHLYNFLPKCYIKYYAGKSDTKQHMYVQFVFQVIGLFLFLILFLIKLESKRTESSPLHPSTIDQAVLSLGRVVVIKTHIT